MLAAEAISDAALCAADAAVVISFAAFPIAAPPPLSCAAAALEEHTLRKCGGHSPALETMGTLE